MPVFFLTDIEKSTEKWEKYHGIMGKALARHDAILKETIDNYKGRVIKHTGDGLFAVFEQGAPLQCALEIQKQFTKENWGEIEELRIRIGLHAGNVEKRGDDYVGAVVNRAIRVMEAAWGGQILLTPDVKNVCSLPEGAVLQDLGVHMLQDLGEPQQIYCLQHPDLELKEFSPIHTLSAHPHNLPAQSTQFIGRINELDELSKLLDNPTFRLINLVGPGGIGKTRLALQAAAEKIEKFRHGVYFIPLDALTISSIQFLVFTIADVLKFSFYSKEDPKKQLLDYLREKEMLLIMDNFEHLVGEAELLTEIFEQAPNVKLLVTSRERLRLKDEQNIELRGMMLPESEKVADFDTYSAIQLFIKSAERVDPSFVLCEKDRSYILQISKLVGCIPLGIELAASWVRSLSCKEIVQEIGKGLDFLTTTLQDVPERHQSLRAVFDYSWDLLSKKEKKIYANLSVFPDSFTKEAAEKVVDAKLEDLQSLAGKSLIRPTKQDRYKILQILREYSLEKFSKNADNSDKIRSLHCKYYTDFVKRNSASIRGRLRKEILDMITTDIENIREAWKYAIEYCEEDEIALLIPDLSRFFKYKGWSQEGEQTLRFTANMLRTKYSMQKAQDKTRLLFTNILNRWGEMNQQLSLYEKSEKLYQESLAIAREYNNQELMSRNLANLGYIAYVRGDYTKAKQIIQQALQISQVIGSVEEIATCYNTLGLIATDIGDTKEAEKLLQKSLSIREESDDRSSVAITLMNLGNVASNDGYAEKAEEFYQKALRIHREFGHKRGIAHCLNNLGVLLDEQGHFEKAEELYQESLSIKQELGEQRTIAITLDNLGCNATKTGELLAAKKYFTEALNICTNVNAVPKILLLLKDIANLFMKEGKKEDTVINYLYVLDHKSSSHRVKEVAAKSLSELKKDFPVARINEIQKIVRAKRLDDIIREVREKIS